MSWVCRDERGRGLSICFIHPKRGDPEFGIEYCRAGAKHEMRFADEESAEYFLLVARTGFPYGTEKYRVVEID